MQYIKFAFGVDLASKESITLVGMILVEIYLMNIHVTYYRQAKGSEFMTFNLEVACNVLL